MEYQASITGKEIDRDWDGRAWKSSRMRTARMRQQL